MGFCRRCGDIVSGPKCRCGGTAVAPVLQWNQRDSKEPASDRWSRTYVSKQTSPHRNSSSAADDPSSSSPVKRFSSPTTSLGSRVSAHIASTTLSRPTSPLKHASTSPPPEAPDILPSPYTSELTKVYGSVLQPKESLSSFRCHVCSAEFPPDATIYPDPVDQTGTRFMCRACFIVNGGSRGDCPSCHRPVLILKSEGGFVENAGRVWHKKCFSCSGCGKSIGDNPIVDLLGRPSCNDCLDTCLQRTDSPRRHDSFVSDKLDDSNKPGALKTDQRRTREGSPAMEELELRLGIEKNKVPDPALSTPQKLGNTGRYSLATDVLEHHLESRISRDTTPRTERLAFESANRNSPSAPSPRRVQATEDGSPVRERYSRYSSLGLDSRRSSIVGSPRPGESPKPTQEAIEEMKNRFLHQAGSPVRQDNPSPSLPPSANTTPRPIRESLTSNTAMGSPVGTKGSPISRIPIRSGRLSASLRTRSSTSSLRQDAESVLSMESIPSTPELGSDFSDTTTHSSGTSSPPTSISSSQRDDDVFSSSGMSSFSESDSFRVATNITGETVLSSGSFSKIPLPKASSIPKASHTIEELSSSSRGPDPSAKCAKCSLPLFNLKSGGRYVTVPEPSSSSTPPKAYHTQCFRCRICDGVFEEKERGQAVFVRGVRGACHLDCAPSEKITMRPVTSTSYVPPQPQRESFSTNVTITTKPLASSSSSPYSSSRYNAPLTSAPSTTLSFPRFGSSSSCPGCEQAVSPMERGVVPGPQNTKWHATCLVCGGKDAKGRGGRRKDGKPGCRKQLDSSAKRDSETGAVWCRDCLLLLPASMRAAQPSPTRQVPLKPTHTGGSTVSSGPFSRITAQNTGTTTIARQFTGHSEGISRHVTGGGLSPTRQLTSSPTKSIGRQYTGGSSAGGTVRPRPKSVIGMRDEGRGMFLVRQMTGGDV